MTEPLAHEPAESGDSRLLQTIYVAGQPGAAARLPPAAKRILTLFDGRRCTARVLQDARISEARAHAVIKKLTREGFLVPVHQGLEQADTLRDLPVYRERGFSAQEEAFFAAEVDPETDLAAPLSLGERVGLYLAELRMRLTGHPA